MSGQKDPESNSSDQSKLVSIVIIYWNARRFLQPCLHAILQQTYRPLEIVFVNNDPADRDFPELLRGNATIPVTTIQNDANKGYAYAANQGIETSRGTYILLLNVDVVLTPLFIETLVNGFEQFPDVGMMGGKVYQMKNGDYTTLIDQSGNLLRKSFFVTWTKQYEQAGYVLGPNGSCGLFRRALLQDLSRYHGEYFDARYFCYWEDIDLYLRAQSLGWKGYYLPTAVAYHERSGSLGGQAKFLKKPLPYQRLVIQNRIATMLKNLPTSLLIRYCLWYLLIECLMWGYLVIRIPGRVPRLFFANLDILKRLSEILRKRRTIQATSQISTMDYSNFFV